MKKLLVIFSSVLLFTSCKKDDECTTAKPTVTASAAETSYLQSYLTANSISATNINGMFYSITTAGAGTSPNLCNSVTITYTGKTITGNTTGTQFDAATSPTALSLSGLIDGWKLVFPLVKSGSVVSLFIPPSLGYGGSPQTNSSGATVIPANSYLRFDITLISVN